jgi:hypothetical protein
MSGQIFPFPLSHWDVPSPGERFFSLTPGFLSKIPLPTALWSPQVPGSGDSSHWFISTSRQKMQFQQIINWPLLIHASATPGGPSRFWLRPVCYVCMSHAKASSIQSGLPGHGSLCIPIGLTPREMLYG